MRKIYRDILCYAIITIIGLTAWLLPTFIHRKDIEQYSAGVGIMLIVGWWYFCQQIESKKDTIV